MLKKFMIILCGVFMLFSFSGVSWGAGVGASSLSAENGTKTDTSPENPILPINGTKTGTSPDDPILPTNTPENPGDPWVFPEIFVLPDIKYWYDPVVAIGYDYSVIGPNFAQVTLPTGIGDNSYNLHLWDTVDFSSTSVATIVGGTPFDFALGGLDRFRIMGIETSANLDPTDPTAFVTGLTFVSSGNVTVTQDPITYDTDVIPEPCTILLLGSGLIGLMGYGRKRLIKKA